MAARQPLHEMFRHELAQLAGIVKRLQIAEILSEVAVRRGYNDLFEALQLTPEPRRRRRPRRKRRNKRDPES
jgi:hypothetical protein